jgi:hypothetical protein
MKKQFLVNNILYTACICLLASCNRVFYIPSTQPIPVFDKKHEFVINAGGGLSEEKRIFDAQVAYSITDKLGIYTNVLYAKEITKNAQASYGYNLEAAVGYYKKLNKYFNFETFAGAGFNNQAHFIPLSNQSNLVDRTSLQGSKLFIVPTFAWKDNSLELAFSSAISNLTFFNITKSASYHSEKIPMKIGTNYFMLENSFTCRLGYKNTKVFGQWTFIAMDRQLAYFENAKASIGISILVRNGWKDFYRK